MATALDQVLEAVRAGLEARRQTAAARADAIKNAADAYAAAVEREALSDLASKVGVGIDAPIGPSAREAALALRAAVAALPELAKSAVVSSGAPTESPPSKAKPPANEGPATSFPLLLEASRRGRIVVLGGLAKKKEKLDRIDGRLGFDAEWIETDRTGLLGIRKLEGRILDGRIAAIVILDGLIGHAHFEPIVRATRQTGTLLVYGDKAGRASLDKAFAEAEAQLAKKGRR